MALNHSDTPFPLCSEEWSGIGRPSCRQRTLVGKLWVGTHCNIYVYLCNLIVCWPHPTTKHIPDSKSWKQGRTGGVRNARALACRSICQLDAYVSIRFVFQNRATTTTWHQLARFDAGPKISIDFLHGMKMLVLKLPQKNIADSRVAITAQHGSRLWEWCSCACGSGGISLRVVEWMWMYGKISFSYLYLHSRWKSIADRIVLRVKKKIKTYKNNKPI